MIKEDIEKYEKAGKIAKEVRDYAREIVKPGMILLEIAKKIEDKIYSLNASPAFPVNLSIDEIAAHYHPNIDDKTMAKGLLKIDIGIHIDGFIADTALTLDLTQDRIHKKLIEATELALDNALKSLAKNPSLHEIGSIIHSFVTYILSDYTIYFSDNQWL